MRASGETLLRLINDILDFSKIEARKLDLERVDFGLYSLLDYFAESLAAPAREKGLELLCTADPQVPMRLRGDPGRLRQILTNLASNSIKFTEKGEVAVRVALEEETETGSAYCDFPSGTRASGSLKTSLADSSRSSRQVDTPPPHAKYGGTGLGLAISKPIGRDDGWRRRRQPVKWAGGSQFLVHCTAR